MLFILGGLWVMLWPLACAACMACACGRICRALSAFSKVLKRHAKRLPKQKWRLHALGCTLAFALSGLIVNLAHLHRGYWLTLTVVTTAAELSGQPGARRAIDSGQPGRGGTADTARP